MGNPTHPEPESVRTETPAGPLGRLPYAKPELRALGDIAQLTRGFGSHGNDGGGFMTKH